MEGMPKDRDYNDTSQKITLEKITLLM